MPNQEDLQDKFEDLLFDLKMVDSFREDIRAGMLPLVGSWVDTSDHDGASGFTSECQSDFKVVLTQAATARKEAQ